MSTNFAKTLVWKHEYDVKLWRHKERTPNTNDHLMPLNETPPWKFSAHATGQVNREIAPTPKFSKTRSVVRYGTKLQSFCATSKIISGCGWSAHTQVPLTRMTIWYKPDLTYGMQLRLGNGDSLCEKVNPLYKNAPTEKMEWIVSKKHRIRESKKQQTQKTAKTVQYAKLKVYAAVESAKTTRVELPHKKQGGAECGLRG